MSFSNVQVDVDALPRMEGLVYQPLQQQYRTVLVLKRSIFLLIITLIVGSLVLGTYMDPLPEGNTLLRVILLTLLILLIIISYVSVLRGFVHKAYALRSHDIIYKTGWLWKRITTAPFNRVQHVSIDQGPLERQFGLSRLKIYTAGGTASDLTIPGLDPATAHELKEYIVAKTESRDAPSDEEQ